MTEATSPSILVRLFGRWLRRNIELARNQGQLTRVVRGYRRLAQWGDVQSQFHLGQCYASGAGVVRNMPEARRWIQKAAEQGHVEAQYAVSHFYLHGAALDAGNPYQPGRYYGAETAGDNAALLFPDGLDLTADMSQAALWLERAAEGGHPSAMCQLATLYAHGNGVEQNSARAVELLKAACSKSLPWAHFLLAQFQMNGQHGLTRDLEGAMENLEYAAGHGHIEAAFQLGTMLVMPGMTRHDPQQAERWLNSAGQRQHLNAMVTLAKLYHDGKVLPRDDIRAAAWFRKAAALGNAQAQWQLGTLFQKGRGVEQDGYEAAHWYEKAGRQGVVPAQYALAMLYRQGEGVLRNNALAAEWFQRAVEGGDLRAMINLALLHISGALGERNKAEADRLFAQVESSTHDPAVLEQIKRYRDIHKVGVAKLPPPSAPEVELQPEPVQAPEVEMGASA